MTERTPWFHVSLALSFLLLMSGVTGIVDGLVAWRERIGQTVRLHVSIRDAVLACLPCALPAWVADDLVVSSGIALSARMA